MRSIHTAKEGDKAKRDYYTKDKNLGQGQGKDSSKKDYYGKGEAESSQEMTEAVWFGMDAERLNLVGHVQQSDFEQIYDGYIPGTQERIRGHKPREDHLENCLYDVVLSCKKSVSMQIHLGKDERLYKAFQDCVLEVAQLVEQDYAQAKRQVNGERNVIETEGIIAVLMPHHTTREQDMGVHMHLLIANGTYCEDGKWRSLRDVGFSHAYYLGDYFSARLAARVQALGYAIRETVTEKGHPSWELAGYTDEQIKVFSKRSESAAVKELIAAGYSRDNALLVTRKAKDLDETIEQMQERWGIEAREHGIEAIEPLAHPVTPQRQQSAEDVLESAIRHYSHNAVHFSRDQIREYAFKLNRPFDVAQLDEAIARHPELIDHGKFGKQEDFQGHFTTAKALEREIRTIKAWIEGQGKATPVMDRETSAQALEEIRLQNGGYELKSGQRGAVIGVLASVNMHQCIHGLSGVGKTSALQQLKVLLDRQGVGVIGLAPSIPAAQTLGEELGIETQTVQKFIRNDIELQPGQFIVIDESGMDSAEMLDIVMQKANAVGARVLLVGDTGQNQAIEAGSPMRSMMAHGAEVHHIDEIIRQQDDIQRQAVELIAKGHGLDALSLLSEHDYVTEIEEREQRVSAIAAEYLGLSAAEQAETLIVTGTNAEKDAISAEIRAGLKGEGVLGEPVKVTGLVGQKLTRESAKAIETYQVGQELTLKRKFDKRVRKTPDVYRVMAVEGDEVVLLRTATETLHRFNPQHQKFVSSVKVTQLRDRALSPEQMREVQFYREGDYVSLSRHYKSTELDKDMPYRVMAKEGAELVVASAGGRLYRFNPKHYRDKKVFSAHEFDIAVGDTLRWTSTNREKGQINGSTVKIAALNGSIATAFTSKGKRLEIDLRQPLAVDYTLCSTSYRSQGSGRANVFVSATNDPTSSREPFYVSISRQIKRLKVWTDSYEGLKRRVAESKVQRNPIELLFGESNGSSPIREHDAAAQRGIEPDAGATGAEPSDAAAAQQLYQQHPDPSERRDGLIPDGVRTATGESEALRDSGRNSGAGWNLEGAEGPTDELGADSRGYDLSGELRDGGDSELRDAVTQQRLDASAANLKSCMERVISSLSVLSNDELVHDSAIVESTREVVEALEPIVSSLEGQPVAVPPKRDLTSAMARVINGLTAMDSEDVFGESEIIAEIKSLVSRVEAHTIAQEQLTQHTNSGDHHVEQNSSRESTRPTARRDTGVDTHARIARTESDRAASSTKRHSADLEPAARGSARAAVPDRDAGAERHDPELTGHHRRADQSAAQTRRGQERDLPAHEAEFSHLAATAQHRRVEHRDVGSESASSRNDRRSPAGADQGNDPEQAGTIATRLFNRATDGISARADAIVRIRLQRELAEPLAQLRATLAQIREVNQLNERLKAEFDARQSSLDAHQAELAAEGKSIAAQKERLFAQMEVQLAQSKVEVLDTTLTEWRSLRQEPELHQIPELAVAPSDKAELTNLIANYPAQKVIDYAMAEYAQVRQHFELGAIGDAKHQSPASATKMPTPRTNSPPKPKQSTAASGRAAFPPKPKPRPQRNSTPRPEKRVPIVAFWQPDYVEAQRPDTLEPNHWEEFKRSAIHPDLVRLNVSSLEGQPVLERLLDEKLGSLSGDANQYATEEVKRIVKPYERVAEGGWWGTAGIDAKSLIDLQPGEKPQQSLWGVFKPDKPILEVKKPLIRYRYGEIDIAQKVQRQNTESLSVALLMAAGINANKFIEYRARKYENPAGTERHLYLPNVPDEIAQRIYAKNDIKPTEAELQSGFWSVVASHPEIPIVVTEGLKKTLSSTSQGEVTIGLAGVNALYRARDEDKEKLPERVLSDEMAVFATPGRSFTFAFDSDTKISTIFNVRAELIRGVELLEAKGSTVKVAKWKAELGKGLDDVIANQGPTVYAVALGKAEAAEREKRIYYRTQYNALVKELRKKKPELSGVALDIEVYLLAITKGELKDGERFLSQSDQARSLKDPGQVTAYIEHIKASAPKYLQQQRALESAKAAAQAQAQLQKELAAVQVKAQVAAEAKRAADRGQYLMIAQQIQTVMVEIPLRQLDLEVYLRIRDNGTPTDSILAQSDHALSLADSDQVRQYIEQIKVDAPIYQGYKEFEIARDEAESIAALKNAEWLARNLGQQQPDGSYLWQVEAYTFWLKDDNLSVTRKGNETVLLRQENEVYLNVTPQEAEVFQKVVQRQKAYNHQHQNNLQQSPAKQNDGLTL